MAVVRIIYYLYRNVLQVSSVAVILLGIMGVAYDHTDSAGRPNRLLRRITLAIALGLLGALAYSLLPLPLDQAGITPVPGHVKFYGLFFAPIGFLAGALAVVYGGQRRLLAPPANKEPGFFWWQGYLVGLVSLWLLFFVYSRIFLNPGILAYALIRSSLTAPVGALLFLVAPFLVSRADKHTAGLAATLGFLLIMLGLLVEILVRMTIFFRINLL